MNSSMWEQKLRSQHPTARWVDDGAFAIDLVKNPEQAGAVSPTIVRKPWGYEIWHVFVSRYAWKTLIILAGKRFSKQLHEKKTETWLVVSGSPLMTLGDKAFVAEPGQLIHVPIQTVHRIEAKESDVEIMEVSTSELEDVVRIEDDFLRN